jgi:hypothetical protein
MIKAEDLRIGDLVRVREMKICRFIPEDVAYKVTQINSEDLLINNRSSVCLYLTNPKQKQTEWPMSCWSLLPIPLTLEILEKNGYKDILYQKLPWTYYRKENSKVQVGYNCESDKNPFSVVKGRVGLKRVNYVHELQHILWALGEDANLKI